MSIVKYFIASCRIRSYWSLCINVHIYCIPIFHLSTILHLSRICVQTTCIYIIYIYIYIMSSRCSPLALSFFLSFFPFFLSLSLSLSSSLAFDDSNSKDVWICWVVQVGTSRKGPFRHNFAEPAPHVCNTFLSCYKSWSVDDAKVIIQDSKWTERTYWS